MPEYNQDGSTTKYGEQVAVLNNYLDNNESLLEAEAKVAKQAINNDEIINNKGTNVIPENIKNLGNNTKVMMYLMRITLMLKLLISVTPFLIWNS